MLVAFIACGVLSAAWVRQDIMKSAARPVNEPTSHYTARTGTQLLVIFFGSSNCGASELPGFKEAMTTMRRVVGGRAAVQGFRPFFIGVAAEKSLNAGLRFLNAMGQFDEIVVGGDWMNEEAVRYFWRDIPGRASLPQIVVVRRSVRSAPRTMLVKRKSSLV